MGPRTHSFGVAAGGLAMAELLAIPLSSSGSEMWTLGPHPILAFLLLVCLGVVLPLGGMAMLWLSRRTVASFLLQLVAAATIGLGMLMAVGGSLALHSGMPLSLEVASAFVPLAVSLVCLSTDLVLKHREDHEVFSAA